MFSFKLLKTAKVPKLNVDICKVDCQQEKKKERKFGLRPKRELSKRKFTVISKMSTGWENFYWVPHLHPNSFSVFFKNGIKNFFFVRATKVTRFKRRHFGRYLLIFSILGERKEKKKSNSRVTLNPFKLMSCLC